MTTKLTPAAKAKAFEAISAMHKAWTAKDGIAVLTGKLNSKHESAAAHIYGLALFAARKEDKLAKVNELFREMCKHAEAELKARLAVENLKDAVPIWAVYKSNLTRGMNLGISPLDHDTEKSFRAAMMEAAGTGAGEHSPAMPQQVEKLLKRTTIADTLRGSLERMILEAQFIKSSKMRQAEGIFQRAAEDLAGLVDQRAMPDMPEMRAVVVGSAAGVQATIQ